jgi:uncharacterized protein YbjT (DUF2867 family)
MDDELKGKIAMVTGAYGYTGKYVARLLLEQGKRVRTLTNHPPKDDTFGGKVQALPFSFSEPAKLTAALQGCQVLYNTYWIRFPRKGVTFEQATANSLTLLKCAKDAGVQRIVHISITNPSADSRLPYFKGKAIIEDAIQKSGMYYSILRPAIIFGDEGILINNMAWMLRHLPAFGAAGNGLYKMSPIFVEDLAQAMVNEGKNRENKVVDALGPETFTYDELVRAIAKAIGVRRPLVHMPNWMVFLAGWGLGLIMRDVVLTWDEVIGLTAGLLSTDAPPLGTTNLTDWMHAHRDTLGRHYMSELARRYTG